MTGFVIRYLFFRLIFAELTGFCYIAPNVTFQRSYGIKAGRNLAVNRGTLIDGKGQVQLGDNVLIGPYVVIASAQHSYANPNLPMIMQTEEKDPVVIGNDVWIGTHSILLPGVHVGDRSIIGAASVVVKDVDSHTIAAGVPAKTIKSIP